MTVPDQPDPIPRRWLPRVRFSLRTLVILVLLAASGFGLWRRWDPWVIAFTISSTAQLEEPSLSDDERYVYLVDSGKSHAEVWNVREKGKVLEKPLDGKSWSFLDGEWLCISGSDDCSATNIVTGEVRQLRDAWIVNHWPESSKIVIQKNGESDAQVIDLPTFKTLGKLNLSPAGGAVSPDGKLILDFGPQIPTSVYDASTLEPIVEIPEHATGGWFLDDSSAFILKNGFESRSLHEAVTGKTLWEAEYSEYFSFHGRFRIDWSATNEISSIHELSTGKKVWSFNGQCCLSPDDRLVINSTTVPESSSQLCEAKSYEIESGHEVARYTNVPGGVRMVFTKDGKYVLGHKDYDHQTDCVLVWDARGGAPLYSVQHFLAVLEDEGCVIGRDGSSGHSFFLCDIRSGRRLCTLQGSGPENRVKVSPSNNFMLTYSFNANTVDVWERRHPAHIWGVAYLPEFWLTLLFAIALPFSLRRDWRNLRR